ncbi:MAG: ATP-binding protein [Thermoanaerobaculia bacterium]|nr:ATP-binding protein [Thermoanaerobaculia bacterium]
MVKRPRGARGFLALAVLLAALLVALGGASLYQKVESFQPLGFEARADAGRWLVTRVDEPDSELRIGDELLLINGEGVGQLDELGGALRARAESELLLLRDQRLETVAYRLPPLDVDYPYLILALIGLAYLLIGLYTLSRDPGGASGLFYLWCLTTATVYLISVEPPFGPLAKFTYLVEEVARIFLAPLTLHLFSVFPHPLSRSPKLKRIVPFFYLPACFLLLLQLDLVFTGGALLVGGAADTTLAALDLLELLQIVIFSLTAAGVLAWRLRRAGENEPQRQAAWIAVGMAAGYIPFLSLYVLPLSLGVDTPLMVTAMAVLPLALVPTTFAYAILRYKLWDIGGVVRNTITLSLTVLIGIFGFALANLTVSRIVPEEFPLGRSLMTFAAGLVIAGLLVPTRRGIASSLERLQYGGSFGKRRALVQFGRELLNERDLDRLCQKLADRLEATLDLKRTNLFLVSGQTLAPVRREEGLPELVRAEAVDRDFWESDVESIPGVELPRQQRSFFQRLYLAGYRYAFPLRVRSNAVGLVVTSYRSEDVPLSSDDLDLVRNLLDQAALAIENAQLLHQVHSQLQEVLRLQAFNQGIIESSPAGIAVLGADNRVRSANQAIAAQAGVDRAALAGRRLRDLLPIEPVPTPEEGIREVSIFGDEGQERFLQVTAAPLREEDAPDQCVLVVQDVTDRVEMERELKEKDRLASLGMLAAGVAHEVNTPITGISSYAQMLLADTPDEDPRRGLLEKVEKQTFRAAQIVNNLLEFARNRRPEQGPVAVAGLVDECLEMVSERIADNQVRVKWEKPRESLIVTGNDGELLQALTNLTVNALEAIGPNGGTLELTAGGDAEWVWIGVEDDGPGIEPQKLEKIFQPFFSSKLGQGGTGLGLAITFNIVRRHGGDIRVESRPGRTRFVVELPRLTI